MDALYNIVLTACFTLFGGVLLLVATQGITRFIAEPLVDFRRLLGEVAYTLVLRANLLFNLPAMKKTEEFQKAFADAKEECRKLASRLHAFSAAVPLYGFLTNIGLVPPLTDVYEASRNLIGLSNLPEDTPPSDVQKHISAVDSEWRTIWIPDAHRDDGERFVVHADAKLTALLELEPAICGCGTPPGPGE